jgi:hypothetical protein
MTIRLRYKLELGVSSSSAEDKDLGNHYWEAVTDALGDGGSRKTKLAAGASDVALTMGGVADAKFIAIKTNAVDANDTPGTINITKDDPANEVIAVVPMSTTKQGFLGMTTTGVTALYASNPGTVDMEITVIVAGD